MIGQTIEIPGEPIPLSRARAGKHGFYDPQWQTKQNVAAYVKQLIHDRKPITNPIRLTIIFQMSIPKSFSKKKQDTLQGKPHVKRPDSSNLLKFYEDALNGILWQDDCLIYDLTIVKRYDMTPKTIITISEYSYD